MITAVYQAKADVKEVIVRVFTYLKMDPTVDWPIVNIV